MTSHLLLRHLASRGESGNPLRVGLIGAGKFGTMFLALANRISGLHVLGVADLEINRIKAALEHAQWPKESYNAGNFDEAFAAQTTHITDDPISLIEAERLEVVVEATGNPVAGAHYALRSIDVGIHIVAGVSIILMNRQNEPGA